MNALVSSTRFTAPRLLPRLAVAHLAKFDEERQRRTSIISSEGKSFKGKRGAGENDPLPAIKIIV
eukprot:1158313-Pelagomonas_calceolata.AAC.1